MTLALGDDTPVADGESLLEHLAVLARTDELRLDESLQYGFWEFVLRQKGDRVDVWEYDRDGHSLRRGADLTLRYWREQHDLCARFDAPFTPPAMRQMVVVSNGVFEGEIVKGVRYPSPEHMSGWWLITDRYNGDVKTLKPEHAFHFAQRRTDLVRYFALPFGFRFDLTSGQDVWFDDKVIE